MERYSRFWQGWLWMLLSLLIHAGYLLLEKPPAVQAAPTETRVMALSIRSRPAPAVSAVEPNKVEALPEAVPTQSAVQTPKPVSQQPVRSAPAAANAQPSPPPEQVETRTVDSTASRLVSQPEPALTEGHDAEPFVVPAEPVVTQSPRYAEPPAHPVYPAMARRRGWQGEVWLEIVVGPEGVSSEPILLRSSGFELLDKAALEAARQWRFLPERRNGQAVASRVQVPVQFALR